MKMLNSKRKRCKARALYREETERKWAKLKVNFSDLDSIRKYKRDFPVDGWKKYF